MINWQTRYNEWRVLFDYCRENTQALEQRGAMRALVLCLQAHWQDMRRLRGDNMTKDFMTSRLKPKPPGCPACGKEAQHDHDDWFDCPNCKLHFNVDGFSKQLAEYQSYLENRRLDQWQLDKEIALAEVASHTICPKCGSEGIGLYPNGVNPDGTVRATWFCDGKCGAEIDKDWMNEQFVQHGFAPLACVRCGEVYDMTEQHICDYGKPSTGE